MRRFTQYLWIATLLALLFVPNATGQVQKPLLDVRHGAALKEIQVAQANVALEYETKATFLGSTEMEFVPIPSGIFSMGNSGTLEELIKEFYPDHPDRARGRDCEFPQHEVTISKPFLIGKCETTVAQFEIFMKESGHKTNSDRGMLECGWDPALEQFVPKVGFNWKDVGLEHGAKYTVINVSWSDAVAYCDWLSKKNGRRFRLPTEAEWEFACRAGTITHFSFGDSEKAIAEYGNTWDSSGLSSFANMPGQPTVSHKGDDGFGWLAPVGSFKPNEFGIFDMHGNAAEWCNDEYSPDYYTTSEGIDPRGPEGESRAKVVRGGGCFSSPRSCRSASRFGAAAGSVVVGFRVVCELD